ncbi:MAG TPA: hypothetical protein PKY77_21935 [Phycisphaerae bacterium]|nr:hypothetical protein [Phycisphaerae bacterium]HRY71244.1 hypothetical protein [Phycisphaerae bacterium]HSA29610.1 hypothetical protein [Phycisphaerae bacterium]
MVLVDTEPPLIPDVGWGSVSASGPDTVQLDAGIPGDESGTLQFRFERDGTAGDWQSSRSLVVESLAPNTPHTFGMMATDRAPVSHGTAWSSPVQAYTLAQVPPPPSFVSATENSLSVQLSSGANPASTELAVRLVSTGKWVALDGSAADVPAWADAAKWGTVGVSGLSFDTMCLLSCMARNGDEIETKLSEPLNAKTAAPVSGASLVADREWVYGAPEGATALPIRITAEYVNNPHQNNGYSYEWEAHINALTGVGLTVVSGGGADDNFFILAAPGPSSSQTADYFITCTIVGAEAGNSVSKTIGIEVRPFVGSDFDADGDVDLDDLMAFEACFSGPAVPYATGCAAKDYDGDNDVDQADFGKFQRCFSGSRSADPECAN